MGFLPQVSDTFIHHSRRIPTVVSVVVRVIVIGWAHVVHVVHGTALHAARLGLVTGEGDPENAVRVGGETSATDVLLVTGRVDRNGLLHRAYDPSASCRYRIYAHVTVATRTSNNSSHTETAGVQWPHVEDIDTLHLSKDFETLKTGGLLGVGRDSTGLRTRGQKIVVVLDFYKFHLISN